MDPRVLRDHPERGPEEGGARPRYPAANAADTGEDRDEAPARERPEREGRRVHAAREEPAAVEGLKRRSHSEAEERRTRSAAARPGRRNQGSQRDPPEPGLAVRGRREHERQGRERSAARRAAPRSAAPRPAQRSVTSTSAPTIRRSGEAGGSGSETK